MTFSKDLRYRLEYLGFRAAQAVATALPLEAVSRTSGLAWRLIAPRLYRQARALSNLAIAYPELALRERKRIAAAMWENLGRTFGESFHLKEIIAQKRVRFEPPEQLDEIIRGGPCVVCGLHLGNWELVAYASKLMGASFTGVYQRLSNPLVDEETRKLRAFLYDGGLLPKTPVTARALMKTAKSGGYPAFLADLRDDNGAAVPFFGKPALSTPSPPCSPARPDCRSTPAPRSVSPTCASSSAPRGSRSPTPTTRRPTPSPGPPRCRRSSRPSSARRPNNGCGPTGNGTSLPGQRLSMAARGARINVNKRR
jgi:Kdo2-lipid IVA lauroyltransferase/acyltransferase